MMSGTLKQMLIELSDLLGAEPPFSIDSLSLLRRAIESVLQQIKEYKRPEDFKSKGVRPKKINKPSERHTMYRKKWQHTLN